MIYYLFLIQTFLMYVSCVNKVEKILIFNDMHLNENFLKDHCPASNCTDLGYKGEDYSQLTDSPEILIDTVLDRAKANVEANNEKIMAIIITGDFVVHDFMKNITDANTTALIAEKMAKL